MRGLKKLQTDRHLDMATLLPNRPSGVDAVKIMLFLLKEKALLKDNSVPNCIMNKPAAQAAGTDPPPLKLHQ